MIHYVVEGHLFDKAADKLLTSDFTLSWYDRFPAYKPEKIDPTLEDVLKLNTPKTNRSNRVKYRCDGCGMQVWCKSDLKICCGGP